MLDEGAEHVVHARLIVLAGSAMPGRFACLRSAEAAFGEGRSLAVGGNPPFFLPIHDVQEQKNV